MKTALDMFVQNAQLDEEQLTQLDLLIAECKSTDINAIPVYRHLLSKDRHRPANLLYYEPDSTGVMKLVGFLAAFFFSKETCEIALMVAPQIRRRGIGRLMLKTILPLIKAEGIERLMFSSPHGINEHWFSNLKLDYQGSEFEMLRTDNQPLIIKNTSVNIRLATHTDIPTLCAMDMACFPGSPGNNPSRIQNILNDSAYSVFVLNEANTIVGKAHMHWHPHHVRLSDIAIFPDYQRRGLGGILMAYCINHALATDKTNISLDVETKNKQALYLYTHLGFSIINAHDYWSIDEFGLTDFLHPL